MKIRAQRLSFSILSEVIFWLISVIAWNMVFNPSVQSTRFIKGWDDDFWLILVVLYCIFSLYLLLPLFWLLPASFKKIRWTGTVLFLGGAIFMLVHFVMPDIFSETVHEIISLFWHNYVYTVIFHLTIIAAVYFNLRMLIPHFFNKSRFFSFILSGLSLTVIAAYANLFLFDFVIDPLFPQQYYISYFKAWELMLIVFGYLIFTGMIFLFRQYAVLLIANRDKVTNELSALKAQINPHFLFNNLNTIYALASRKDEKTAGVVLQLSDFLRYVLYDTTSETISLEKEAEIINTYVELQKERIEPGLIKVTYTVEGEMQDATIAPLLLLPLAENCFKHGIGKGKGFIDIRIRFDGRKLFFETVNTLSRKPEKALNDESGGIGITNVKKRLELLYPDKYTLVIGAEKDVYKVKLELDIRDS